MISYLNGSFIPRQEAVLHVSDLAIQRGYGIFEFFKVRKGSALFLDDYFDRFYRSAAILQLPVPLERDALQAVVYKLLQQNQATDCGIKFILTGGYSPDAYSIASPNFLIEQYPLTLHDHIQPGIHVITHEHVREVPEVKTINYISGIMTLRRMHEAGASDVLFHKHNRVTEFPRCNFFLITKEGVLRTPGDHVLQGITRKNILALAPAYTRVEAGDVTLQDVYNAREAFLTSTTKRLIPITQVDDVIIGSGETGALTRTLFHALVEREDEYIRRNRR